MKASQKKIISALICAVLLLSAGCKNVPDETSANLADERTTSETSTTETTAFETTEAVIRPDLFPKDIWTYQFECDPLPENVNLEDIVLTLGSEKNPPNDTGYSQLHPKYDITIKNNSPAPIDVYNIIFVEEYTVPGRKQKIEYYNSWVRVPYDYTKYFADMPTKTTLMPGEELVLTFYNDWECYLNDFEFLPGPHRFAIYMDGGVRYLEFPIYLLFPH